MSNIDTGPLYDLTMMSFGAWVLFMLLMGISRLVDWIVGRYEWSRLTMGFGGLFALSLLMMTAFAGFALVISPTKAILTSRWLGTLLIGLAALLFIIKQKALMLYGLIEVATALAVVAYLSYSHNGSMGQRLASAATATYFLIRGMDNLFKSEAFTDIFCGDPEKQKRRTKK